MKKGWVSKQLGEVCDLYQPKTISAKEMVADGQYPVFGANGMIGRYDKFNHEEPQLLITCRGATCGSVNISEPMSWITGNSMVVRPIDDSVSVRFLEYLFRGGIDISKVITGAAQPQITRQTLSPVVIPYPTSKTEQQRIVAILDEAFAAISKAKENAEKNLANSREVFELSFDSLFTKNENWGEKKLGDIGLFRNGINYTQTSKGEEVKIVGVGNFKDRFWIPLENLNSVVLDGVLSSSDELKQGDILTVRSNGNQELIGRCMLVGIITEKISHSGFTIRIRLSTNQIIPEYLCHFLRSGKARKQLIASGTGTNIKSLNQVALSALSIPVPSKPEQQTIIDKIYLLSTETKKLETIYKQKLTALDELKKSILERAFRGELISGEGIKR